MTLRECWEMTRARPVRAACLLIVGGLFGAVASMLYDYIMRVR